MTIEDLISQYIDGDLASEAEAELHHRLAVSPEARALFRAQIALRATAKSPKVLHEPSEKMRADLFARLQREEGMKSVPVLSSSALAAPVPHSIPSERLASGRRDRRRRLVPVLLPFLLGIIISSAIWVARDGGFGGNRTTIAEATKPIPANGNASTTGKIIEHSAQPDRSASAIEPDAPIALNQKGESNPNPVSPLEENHSSDRATPLRRRHADDLASGRVMAPKGYAMAEGGSARISDQDVANGGAIAMDFHSEKKKAEVPAPMESYAPQTDQSARAEELQSQSVEMKSLAPSQFQTLSAPPHEPRQKSATVLSTPMNSVLGAGAHPSQGSDLALGKQAATDSTGPERALPPQAPSLALSRRDLASMSEASSTQGGGGGPVVLQGKSAASMPQATPVARLRADSASVEGMKDMEAVPLSPSPSLSQKPAMAFLAGVRQNLFVGLTSTNVNPELALNVGAELGGMHQIYGMVGRSEYHHLTSVDSRTYSGTLVVSADPNTNTSQKAIDSNSRQRTDLRYEIWGGVGYRVSGVLSTRWRVGGGFWLGAGSSYFRAGAEFPVGYQLLNSVRIELLPTVEYTHAHDQLSTISNTTLPDNNSMTGSGIETMQITTTTGAENDGVRAGLGIGISVTIR
jgi:hypothetical protein